MSTFRQKFIDDGMRHPTRAARRKLLLSAVITHLLVKGQLMPLEIAFLGLKIGNLQEKILLQTLLVLLIYYLIKFYLYMWIDGEIQITRAYESLIASESTKTYQEYKKAKKESEKAAFGNLGLSGALMVFARVILDNKVPIIGALYAIVLVIDAL